MATKKITLEFHGGAGEVTGSCYLLKTPGARILVDCGLFQGSRFLEKLNYEEFKFNPADIDAVFVTHSHIDHVGRIPKLIRKGFHGPIYSTEPTKKLAYLMLQDALSFMEEPDEILYTAADVELALQQWRSMDYYVPQVIGDTEIVLRNSGHILGSAMIEVVTQKTKILFTGDFGNTPSILLPPPDAMPPGVDYLIIESTYGNKIHEDVVGRALQLERAIEDAATRNGTLMIPTFATERTQDILYELNDMIMNSRIPKVPVFVDSPLAIRVTDVFRESTHFYNKEVQKILKKDPHIFDFKGLRLTETVKESKRINDIPPPKIILAGSGMSTGGRILHHERRYLQDKNSILFLVGYQARGSLGRLLLEGAREVKIFGETLPVRAEVRNSGGYSAHADRPQLFAFVKKAKDELRRVFVVQGESEASRQFAQDIKDNLGIPAEPPKLYESFELE